MQMQKNKVVPLFYNIIYRNLKTVNPLTAIFRQKMRFFVKYLDREFRLFLQKKSSKKGAKKEGKLHSTHTCPLPFYRL